MYWEITPCANHNYDLCIIPVRTDADHHKALNYAKDRLEELWDAASAGEKKFAVTMELCDKPIPRDCE